MVQEALIYDFSLERNFPIDHLLKLIDLSVELSNIRDHLRPYDDETGGPSVNPDRMIRMLIHRLHPKPQPAFAAR